METRSMQCSANENDESQITEANNTTSAHCAPPVASHARAQMTAMKRNKMSNGRSLFPLAFFDRLRAHRMIEIRSNYQSTQAYVILIANYQSTRLACLFLIQLTVNFGMILIPNDINCKLRHERYVNAINLTVLSIVVRTLIRCRNQSREQDHPCATRNNHL